MSTSNRLLFSRPQFLLATAAMASGLALVIAVLSNTSLVLMLVFLGSFAGLTFAFKWLRSSVSARRMIQKKVTVGVSAGLIATAAYDASRLLLVKLGGFSVSPFKALPIFGVLILGENAPKLATDIAGIAYHLLNGMMFTVAYCFVFGGRHWLFGVLWALGLEASMLMLYPGWLHLEQVMQEFTVMSMTGHIVYGAVLGSLCQRWLKTKTPDGHAFVADTTEWDRRR